MPGLRYCSGFPLVAASGGHSLVAEHRLLIVVAALVVQHGVWGAQASVAVARGLMSCSSQALEHRLWSTDSVVMLHGLSCSTACEISLDQG